MGASGQSGLRSMRVEAELTGEVRRVSDGGVLGFSRRYICSYHRFQNHWEEKTVQTKNQ